MNWYRATFARCGQAIKVVELSAHDAADAMVCAGVKSRLMDSDEYEDGEIELVDLECIEPPERILAARRRRRLALRGVGMLSARLARRDA